MAHLPTPRRGPPGFVRIIAGRWRSRRLPVADVPGLRPTPDRVRVALFNWLRPYLPGARCLDLFAGTGALGFEAASEGAAHVTLVEFDAGIAAALRQALNILDADGALMLKQMAAGEFLKLPPLPYDVVFVDPPYAMDVAEVLARLRQGWLTSRSWVYLERGEEFGVLPGYEVVKYGRAGQVHYGLLRLTGTDAVGTDQEAARE
ncbi:MAG: 16S rRNA (guanine(966)-N(2))-methyltransferase RsmD [Gammaproteobacteria bacterium]|nr:16S rRNA (guanine(966)-N(2))-methyltransferase RsmD [Gammaproteobacteria bacterium]